MSSIWKKCANKRNSNRAWDKERRYTVRGVRRDPVDISKLSKALLGLVMAEAERQAQAEHAASGVENVESEVTSSDGSPPGGDGDA